MNELDLRNVKKDVYCEHLPWSGESPSGNRFVFTNYYLRWNGHPWLPIMGEFHYSRYPHDQWEDELRKMKACGINIIATYCFWIHHEEHEGVFDWSGDRDLRCFVELCAKHDLLCWPRLGPFCHGETRNGGIPDWLYGRPFPLRCNNEQYLTYVRRLYQQIARQLEGLYFKDGGPVMAVQLENEFMQSGAPWEVTCQPNTQWVTMGQGGNEHMLMLKQIAQDMGIDVPIYACTAWGSPVPEGELLPILGGGYAFHAWNDDPEQEGPKGQFIFQDMHQAGNRPYDETRVPYCACETGGGMQVFYRNRPVVPGYCTEALSLMTLAAGCNLQGYYMFHGGTNPVGNHSFLNEHRVPRLSYDFQAPLREFGQLHDSFRRLKRLHLFLNEFGDLFAPMLTALPQNALGMKPEDTQQIRYAARFNNDSGFVFLNNYQDHVRMPERQDVHLRIILPEETIEMPCGHGLTLSRDVCAMLPFNLEMGGIRLKSAVAQLMTRLEVDGVLWYFFFIPDGMTGQYVFDVATVAVVELDGHGRQYEMNGLLVVEPEAGLESVIRLMDHNQQSIHLCTLTHEESLNFWVGEMFDRRRILITKAAVMFGDRELELRQEQDVSFEVYIFPHVDYPIYANGKILAKRQKGSFQYMQHKVATWSGDVDIQTSCRRNTSKISSSQTSTVTRHDQAVVTVDRPAWSELSDLRLKIDYEGDLGEAYMDGLLIHDNFNNGQAWEIGLKRFAGRLSTTPMYFCVHSAPQKEKQAEMTEMAAIRVQENEVSSALMRIEIAPEYRLIITI